MMKKKILMTESEFYGLVGNMVKCYLKEYSQNPEQYKQEIDSWNDYDNSSKRNEMSDLMNYELDRNMNLDDTRDMATAYSALDDPMIRKVHGSTLRDRLSDTMGNEIDKSSKSFNEY